MMRPNANTPFRSGRVSFLNAQSQSNEKWMNAWRLSSRAVLLNVSVEASARGVPAAPTDATRRPVKPAKCCFGSTLALRLVLAVELKLGHDPFYPICRICLFARNRNRNRKSSPDSRDVHTSRQTTKLSETNETKQPIDRNVSQYGKRNPGTGGDNDDDFYDPFEHREVDKPVSDLGTITNLIKSSLGTALFAMPNAFACVGLVNGIIATGILCFIIIVCAHFLLNTHYLMCSHLKKPTLMYDELVVATLSQGPQKAWASPTTATIIVDAAMMLCYLGIGSVYIVFVSGIIHEVFGLPRPEGPNYNTFVLFPFFMLMNMMKHLRAIAPISMVGNLLLVSAALIGIVYALKDGIGDTWVPIVTTINTYPRFVGTVIFSMSSPGVVSISITHLSCSKRKKQFIPFIILAIDHTTKNPQKYGRLLGLFDWGMIVVVVMQIFVGSIGYLKWGEHSLGNFIRNHLRNDVPTLIALFMQGLSIYLSYGLQCYMPISLVYYRYILPNLEKGTLHGSPYVWDLIKFSSEFILTLLYSFFLSAPQSGFLAVFIPYLDLFMGLVGSVCISMLAIFFPTILFILVNYQQYGRYKWKLILAITIMVIGLFGCISGMVTNLIVLAEHFSHY
ncbi:proton-coupled amino acid transporter-like protein CG1139 [Prorops nasuta]|uniref:proton-coupled amino acid transporter-like protein CG1139 n=1 Tax=Prorops nasuta TaxID=863751 RepID=UPI0034CF3442